MECDYDRSIARRSAIVEEGAEQAFYERREAQATTITPNQMRLYIANGQLRPVAQNGWRRFWEMEMRGSGWWTAAVKIVESSDRRRCREGETMGGGRRR